MYNVSVMKSIAYSVLKKRNSQLHGYIAEYRRLTGEGRSLYVHLDVYRRGSRGGEMGEFSPPLFLSPLLSCFSYPSNIEIIFDFSDIITKIHPPFQNPGSALGILNLYLFIINKHCIKDLSFSKNKS